MAEPKKRFAQGQISYDRRAAMRIRYAQRRALIEARRKARVEKARKIRKRRTALRRVANVLIAVGVVGIGLEIAAVRYSHDINQFITSVIYPNKIWAGYTVNGSKLDYVSARWTVPSVSGATEGYSSAWVGIGGLGGNLLQIGTEQDCSPTGNGCSQTYFAWWSAGPQNINQEIGAVRPGDSITAYVERVSSGLWKVGLSDADRNMSFSKLLRYSPKDSSAEVIMENPGVCNTPQCNTENLADFGTIHFYDAAVNGSDGYINTKRPLVFSFSSGSAETKVSSITGPGDFSVKYIKRG